MRRISSPGAGRTGFSLIELLIVIAIIAVLVSLIMAAAQTAREAANKAVCSNNLRQMGIAANSYVMVHGRYPTGGWGWSWVGDPDRPGDLRQSGGWLFNILPYTEHKNLHDMGKGLPKPEKDAAILARVSTPVAMYNCPTRRTGGPWPNYYSYTFREVSGTPQKEARTDYAGNVGSGGRDEIYGGPGSHAEGDDPAYAWPDTSDMNGIIYQRSWIRPQDITKGPGNVYLFGEKYLNPDQWYTGNSGADNECMYTGMNNDICRVTANPPLRDRPGVSDTMRFGSNHRMGCNMAMCDGSVRFVLYTVDPAVHSAAGNRNAN